MLIKLNDKETTNQAHRTEKKMASKRYFQFTEGNKNKKKKEKKEYLCGLCVCACG